MEKTRPVQKGKQDAKGQAKRRQAIIDFIRENGPVKSGEIQKALGLSRSSLSDDMSFIRTQGLIESPKKGLYLYKHQKDESSPEPAEPVKSALIAPDKSFLRRWLILASLSECGQTFEELHDTLADIGIECSSSTLRIDLNELCEEKLISAEKLCDLPNMTDYYSESESDKSSLYYSSHALIPLDESTVDRFLDESLLSRTAVQIQSYEKLKKKLELFRPSDEFCSESFPAGNTGRKNQISSSLIDRLSELDRLHYKKEQITVVYRTNKGSEYTVLFSLGLVVYSSETGRIYLIGKDDQDWNTTIPLDSVDMEKTRKASASEKNTEQPAVRNKHYQSKEFKKIFSQMLNISTDEPIKVRVRFTNLPFIKEKVERLYEARKLTARITLTADESEFIYTDTIRGFYDFARYLRSFGSTAVVEEPPELRRRMVETNKMILALYE